MPENNLTDIIIKCKEGIRSAQEQVYRQYYGYAMSICLPYTKTKTEAEEVANDGFMKVFTKIDSYDLNYSFKGWMRRIMINSAIDYFRQQKKHYYQVDLGDAKEIDDFDDNVIDHMSASEIIDLIQELPPSYKMVFNLYVIEGYKHHEIADKLNISEGTSKSNLAKARKKLKVALNKINT